MAEQLEMAGFVDEGALRAFLAEYVAIEQQEEELREAKRLVVEQYKEALPMRAVRTAVKVCRSRQKLAEHAKEPLSYMRQGVLEALVERELSGRRERFEALIDRPSPGPGLRPADA